MKTRWQSIMHPSGLPGEWLERVGTGPGAIVSDDSKRRFLLWRYSGDPRPEQRWMLFILLNPSTADAVSDDPTIRKCREFAWRADCRGVEVVNLISERSPKPAFVGAEREPAEADEILARSIRRCDRIVAGWGALAGLTAAAHMIAAERIVRVRDLVQDAGKKIECLSQTLNGNPGHPLYIPYSAKLSPWPTVAS